MEVVFLNIFLHLPSTLYPLTPLFNKQNNWILNSQKYSSYTFICVCTQSLWKQPLTGQHFQINLENEYEWKHSMQSRKRKLFFNNNKNSSSWKPIHLLYWKICILQVDGLIYAHTKYNVALWKHIPFPKKST